jgi:hypothetical protein
MANNQQIGAAAGGGAGAIIGSFFGMPQLGFAIGWAAGAWIGGALDPPKTQITDFGAEAFPPFNTSVRGATIPVLFGTNRVSSQIIWQGNQNTIRSEQTTGDGGKGGGSGGSGKGPQSTTVSYQYKMDIIYHLGLVSSQAQLIGGWIGAKRISNTTINQINTNYGAGFEPQELYFAENNSDQILTFTSAEYFPGNLPETQSWQPIIDGTGHDMRWPGTCWVGFDQLDLGSSPVIPQISWEVGELESVAQNTGSGIIWYKTPSSQGSCFVQGGPDIYGNLWTQPINSARGSSGPEYLRSYSAAGALLQEYEVEDLVQSWQQQKINGIPWGSSLWEYGVLHSVAFRVIGNYMYMFACFTRSAFAVPNPEVLVEIHLSMASYINSDGTLSDPIGGAWQARGVTGATMSAPVYLGPGLMLMEASESEDTPLVACGCNGPNIFIMQVLPSIRQLRNGSMRYDWIAYRFSSTTYRTGLFRNDTTVWKEVFRLKSHVSTWGVTLDTLDGLGTRTSYIYGYLSPGYFNSASANQFNIDFFATFPNGGVVRLELPNDPVQVYSGINTEYVSNLPDPELISQFKIRATDGTLTSEATAFDDDGKGWTDTVTAADTYYLPDINTSELDGGTELCIFYAPVNGDPAYPATLTASEDVLLYWKFRAYVFNPLTGDFVRYAKSGGPMFRRQELVPTSGGVLATTNPSVQQMQIRLNGTEVLVYFHSFGSGGTNPLIPQPRVGHFRFGYLGRSGKDITPPEIIRAILVNTRFGLYPGRSIIDETSYAAAVLHCQNNSILVSCVYKNDGKAQAHIEKLLAIYDGYLVVDVTAGTIKFGLTDLNNVSVRTLNNNNLVIKDEGTPPVSTTKGAKQDTYNLIRINFLDRSIDYKQNQIEEGDEVDQDVNGIRLREFAADFVMSEATARRMAARALWSNLYTRDVHQFYLGWKDADLEPGDVVTLVDSFSNLNQVCRISNWKEVERGLFEVSAAQLLNYIPGVDPTAVNSATYSMIDWAGVNSAYLHISSKSTQNPNLLSPPPAYFNAYETPPEFSIDGQPRIFVGWIPDNRAAGARLYVSADGTTFGLAQEVMPHPIYGRFLTPLPAGNPLTYQTGVEALLYVSSLNPGINSFHIDGTLADVNAAAMHAGLGLLWVGSEMVAYQGVTLVSQNRYRFNRLYRGWGGTTVGSYDYGAYFWRHGGGLFQKVYDTSYIGQTLIYKVVPLGFNGMEYDIASVSAKSYTVLGTHFKPLPAGAIQLNDYRGINRRAVNSTIDIPLFWDNGARGSGYGFGGAGRTADGYGNFTADIPQHTWRVNIVGSGNVTVRSTVVTTPNFTYTSSMNAADNGAWRGTIAAIVTPRNSAGDAIRSSVVSLELFA